MGGLIKKQKNINKHAKISLTLGCRDTWLNRRFAMVRYVIEPWAKIRRAKNGCAQHLKWILFAQVNLANLTSAYIAFQLDLREPFKFTKFRDISRISRISRSGGNPAFSA